MGKDNTARAGRLDGSIVGEPNYVPNDNLSIPSKLGNVLNFGLTPPPRWAFSPSFTIFLIGRLPLLTIQKSSEIVSLPDTEVHSFKIEIWQKNSASYLTKVKHK